jgi:hypothetical protein
MTTATFDQRINQALDILMPFGQPQLISRSEGRFDTEAVIEVARNGYSITVTIDDCSQPRFVGIENGQVVMDTRDNLESCLAAFNA